MDIETDAGQDLSSGYAGRGQFISSDHHLPAQAAKVDVDRAGFSGSGVRSAATQSNGGLRIEAGHHCQNEDDESRQSESGFHVFSQYGLYFFHL